MTWVEVFVVLVVSHLVGDFVLQTDWQAANKWGGLGSDPERRRALLSHVTVYTLCFVPAMVWIAAETGQAWRAPLTAVVVFVPHLIQDDGRLLDAWIRRVKGVPESDPGLRMAVDQAFHLIFLFGTALLLAA